jgi:hypothetical protein
MPVNVNRNPKPHIRKPIQRADRQNAGVSKEVMDIILYHVF